VAESSILARIAEALPELKGDEAAVLAEVAGRLLLGQRQYGVLQLAGDPRDWVKEARDETLDLLVYAANRFLTATVSGAPAPAPRDSEGRILWLVLPIGLSTWKVYLVSHEHKELEGNEGMTDFWSCSVYIAEDLPHGARIEVLGHEMKHVSRAHYDKAAAAFVYARAAGSSHDEVEEEALGIEEVEGCVEGPRLLEGFVRGGYLKLPEVP
jgi:hypothetical protein